MSEAMEQSHGEPAWGQPVEGGTPPPADSTAPVGGFPETNPGGHLAPGPPPPAQGVMGYCRVCGRGLASAEAVHAQGVLYCAEHAPFHGERAAHAAPPPYAAPAGDASPALAFLLGLIPGVGAVYNTQYVKAVVHVVVFGLLISIVSSGSAEGFEPLFGLLIGLWYLYMPFEAYHTAKQRACGLPVGDVSSLFPMRTRHAGFPIGPIALIVLGVIFLLAQFDLISVGALLRFWPVLLIAAGAWMLYERIAPGDRQS